MSRLEAVGTRVLKQLSEFRQLTKAAVEASDDNTKVFMADMCARKAEIELDSCMRFLREAGGPNIRRKK